MAMYARASAGNADDGKIGGAKAEGGGTGLIFR